MSAQILVVSDGLPIDGFQLDRYQSLNDLIDDIDFAVNNRSPLDWKIRPDIATAVIQSLQEAISVTGDKCARERLQTIADKLSSLDAYSQERPDEQRRRFLLEMTAHGLLSERYTRLAQLARAVANQAERFFVSDELDKLNQFLAEFVE